MWYFFVTFFKPIPFSALPLYMLCLHTKYLWGT